MQRRSLFRISASLALLGSGFGLAACGGGGGDPVTEPGPPAPPAPPPGPVVRTFAYVANYEPGAISAYRIGGDGALTLAGADSTGSQQTESVVVHPSGRFAYAINEEGYVSAHAINAETGVPSFIGSFAEDDPPSGLCFHPGGIFAYGGLAGGRIAIYRVLDSGALEQEFTVDVVVGVRGLAVAGQLLFVAGSDDTVSSFLIDVDTGLLDRINDVLTAANPYAMAVAPSGGFLYVRGADDGASVISVHAINTAGELQPGTATEAGLFGGALAIHPSRQFAYAVTAVPGDGCRVTRYIIEQATGALRVPSISPAVPEEIFDLAISPSGQHVYTTRTGFLTSYTVEADGTLTEGATTAVSNPAGITIVNIIQ